MLNATKGASLLFLRLGVIDSWVRENLKLKTIKTVFMNKNFWYIVYAFTLLSSCGVEQSKYDEALGEIESLKLELSKKEMELKMLHDSVTVLKYPADQRLLKAKELTASGNFDDALNEIEELKRIFPNSSEAKSSSDLLQQINEKKEAARKEQERIKALGFKAISEQSTVKIDYNTITLSGISVGNTFTFDAYDDRYFYNDADRGTKYVTMQMSVTSTSHDPDLPEVALYGIQGGEMNLVGTFRTEFARWSDYGAYLGNYHDSRNDFAKVSTVKFKLGLQVENPILSNPYAIVVKKVNVLDYTYDRFSNPPISYVGSANYPSSLKVDDFSGDYVIVKRFNLK